MASYNQYKESLAYGNRNNDQDLVYVANIWTQFTNEIAAAGFSTNPVSDAAKVITDLSTYAQEHPNYPGSYSITEGNATGSVQATLSYDYTPPPGFNQVWDIQATVTVNDPVQILINTNPAGVITSSNITQSFLTPLNSTPAISVTTDGSGYTFAYWSVAGGTVVDTLAPQTNLNAVTGPTTVTAVLAPTGPTPTPTLTPTPTPTPTSTGPTPTPTLTPTPTVTPTPGPTGTPTPTPTVTPTPPPGQLAIYTPWVVALTNTPVWVETVYPISQGVTKYGVDWNDSTGQQFYYGNPNGENWLTYTYKLPATGTLFYNTTVNAAAGVTAPSRTLNRGGNLSGLYIKSSLPTYDINNYFDPTTQIPTLPYQLKDVMVGSNEWVVSDVINSSFSKLNSNFNYLRNISQVLNLNNTFYLIEWTAQLAPDAYTSTITYGGSAFAWHTNISGLNWENKFNSISSTGVADGIIKDIKSYSFTNKTAPDYYTYIAYSGSGTIPDHIQIRTNDYRNTLILSATNLSNSTPPFNSISAIDVIDNQLYILDTNTIYKTNLITTGALSSSGLIGVQKVGGNVGGVNDKNNFNNPTDIRACNELLYVADSNNSCVKVYNTSLSWINTIYSTALSSYSIQHIEINPINNNVYALGQTFAPIAPVLTNISTLGSVNGFTNYSVSFVHDGARLNNPALTNLSNFILYGLVSGSQTYIPLTTAVMLSATAAVPIANQIQTVMYTAASGITYSGFAVQALGANNFNSVLSNTTPTGGSYTYASPYTVFELDSNSNIVNSFTLPSNTKHIVPAGNIQSTTLIKKMVIDPTGAFIYFITPNYIYKYLANGVALNRITDPASITLGSVETFKSGFIDNRLNFFLTTDKRIFKYVDIPNTLNLYNTANIDTLFLPLSAITINSNEFIQDWVYNKSILRLLKNHEILYKSIQGKYNINLDINGNLIANTGSSSFAVGSLRSADIAVPYSIDQNYFIHSNEFVTSNVINRALTSVYNLQLNILQLVTPVINRQTTFS